MKCLLNLSLLLIGCPFFNPQQRDLLDKIRGSTVKSADKLRLAILYALRYEGTADLDALKRELINGGVSQQKTSLIDLILEHCGKVLALSYINKFVFELNFECVGWNFQAKRAPGLFGDGSFISRMAKNLHTGLAGVENVRS